MPSPMQRTRPAGWYRFEIGDFEATVVSDGELILGSATSEFPDAPEAEVRALLDGDFLIEDPMVLQQNALVVNTGKRLALFDTGMGTSKRFGAGAGRLIANLAAAGIAPAEIDAVVLTHPHPDHVWGLVDADGGRVFANAEVFISRADFEFWTDETKLTRPAPGVEPPAIEGARRSLLPYRDRISFVEDGAEALPGIEAIATPGHSIGHMAYRISSAGRSVLNVGDVCHHTALLFANPRWPYRWDTDSRSAGESRVKIFEMAVREGLALLGFHFPFPGLGRVARAGDVYRYVPTPMSLV